MWIYIPGCSPSAPGSGGLTSESDWRFQALARSATWRGKRSAASSWSRRCKPGSWIKRLSGRISEPSMAARGVASVDLVAGGIPCQPHSVAGKQRRGADERDLSSTSLLESLARWDPASSSWRTSAALLPGMGSDDFSGRWPNSGTVRNGRLYARPMLVRHTDESGSLC